MIKQRKLVAGPWNGKAITKDPPSPNELHPNQEGSGITEKCGRSVNLDEPSRNSFRLSKIEVWSASGSIGAMRSKRPW
jgi:hypothetical protein